MHYPLERMVGPPPFTGLETGYAIVSFILQWHRRSSQPTLKQQTNKKRSKIKRLSICLYFFCSYSLNLSNN